MFCKALCVFFLLSLNLFADNDIKSEELKSQEISMVPARIFTEQFDSIEKFESGRMYLKADRLFATPKGVFLSNGHSSILLPELFSDPNGCYVIGVKKCAMKCVNSNCQYCCWDAYKNGILCPSCGYPGEPK